MPITLEPRYDHKATEARWITIWAELQAFRPEFSKPSKKLDPFCIVIPPPNVTGELHVGHALDQTMQDVLTRFARKQGRETLWLPGMDHAGIATQVKVEQKLKKEGRDRHELGREAFIAEVWKWKAESGGKITGQQRRMGFSVDWSRERFTMDEGLSEAVLKVFVDLYNEGLIYRDTRLVNWDPVTRTVLSDLEVEFDEGYEGELYSFAYPLQDGKGEIVVATTRPETMLGDTAIAVHPDDERYKALIGSTVRHPFVDRQIKIVGDAQLVDPEFGTGAVKVTPAHDPNDYEVGRRHKLEFISIFDDKAHINELGGEFAGLERYTARKAVKARLAELGLERGSQKHKMSVGRSQRSGAVVEPMISTQWFVKIKPLAEPAIKAVKDDTIQFFPEQWEKTYFHWMNDIRDWCISRQLWWGHQIPAWYGPDDKIFVAHDEKTAKEQARQHYGQPVELRRDPDVLDTWFSSGLWPFSTLGWPDQKSKDLQRWYPTTVLVTGFDIIFFWVARMIMMGLHFMKAPPFQHVYIHGLLRDEQGKKMSKTIGNVVDPLEAVDEYGADAFRFFLMAISAEGKDSLYSEQRLKGYQNFANKIWNSSRFVLMNLPDGFKVTDARLTELELEAEDYWILSELNQLQANLAEYFENYKFHLAAEQLYAFTWRLFCDWYIEFIKPRLFGKVGEASAEAARQTVVHVLRNLLAQLNPFMPFITEEVNEHLNTFGGYDKKHEQLLTSRRFEKAVKLPKKAERQIRALELLQEVIGSVRTIRAETGIAPDRKVNLVIASEHKELARVVEQKGAAIERLAKIEDLQVVKTHQPGEFDASEVFTEGSVYIPLQGLLDIEKEIKRLEGEKSKYTGALQGIEKKLANPKFTDNAPAEVVAKEKEKLQEFQDRLTVTRASLERMKKLGRS
ncbi:MAG: valine--tRNA ligase [Leptospiraceae bacterium]|nr:valine--tRNA ligase [Leptospiraceae bacterium]